MHLERLDLHGYTVADAMARFVGSYNRLLGEGQDDVGAHGRAPLRGLQIIHGKGMAGSESLIRDALRGFLKAQGKRIKGYDAQLALRGADYLLDDCGKLAYMHGEDVDRNGGQTFVVPFQRLRLPQEWRRYKY